jgi:uncharacterized protein YxjI
MIHPLVTDLSDQTDIEVQTKLTELTKKYNIACRMNNYSAIQQLITFINIYRDELSVRHRQRIKDQTTHDLESFVNVE